MWRTAIQVATLLTLAQAAVASAETIPALEISPNMKVKDIALNSNAVLFCQPNVEDVNLLEELRWLDIDGQAIQNDARKYTEKAPVRENPTVDGLNLIIKSFQREDSGVYTCTASYKKTTLKASITAHPYLAITFVNAPPIQHPIAGEGGRITCMVDAEPEAEIHWYKDGHRYYLDEMSRCAFEKEGIRCSSFSIDDNGNYSCQARVHQFGNADERSIIVDVYTKPIIQHPTSKHKAKEDESLLLKCTAEGNPRPTYSWHDENMTSFKGRLGYEVDETEGTLEINKVAKVDSGFINCVAKNAAGNDSIEFTVEVIVKPKILKFENKTITEGDISTLECIVQGDPPPTMAFFNVATREWYSLANFPTDEAITVIQGSGVDGKLNDRVLVLKFNQASRKHDGLYRCRAENDGGFAEATGHLEVQYIPVILNATNFLLSWINNAVNISCISSAIPNATITWEFNNRSLDSNVTVMETGTSSTITVFPTSKASFGDYTCNASNKLGDQKHTIHLLEATVPGLLLQVVYNPVTATTITFQLHGPNNTGGFPIVEHVVKYKLKDKTWDDPSVKERRWKIGSPYIIEKLQPEGAYLFRFAAINRVGTGQYGEEIPIVMPKKKFPEEPQINRPEGVSVQQSLHPDRYELSWKIPNDNGEPIIFYTISYYTVINSSSPDEGKFETVGNMVERNVTNPMSTSYTIEGLRPNTYYKVQLRANNVIGFSVPNTVYVKTGRDVSGESAPSMAGVPLEAIVGVAVAVLLIVIVVIDVGCYVTSKTGILMFFCVHVCKKQPPSDKVKEAAALEEGKAKDSKEIATTGANNPRVGHDDDEAKDVTEETPMIDGSKKEKEQEANRNAVENDVNVAKDSAV